MNEPRAYREGERLVVENDLIRREFLWNGGNLIATRVEDRVRVRALELAPGGEPDLRLPAETAGAADARLEVHAVPATPGVEAHLDATVDVRLGSLEVRRTFTVFPDVPAVSSRFSFRGKAAAARWVEQVTSATDARTPADRAVLAAAPGIDRLPLPGRHSHLTAVDLVDVTDANNNLVRAWEVLPYRQRLGLVGSILLCRETFGAGGLFVIKEAPLSGAQLAYPGVDFSCTTDEVCVYGLGLEPCDLDPEEWRSAYGSTVGISGASELELLTALKRHLRSKRRMEPGRDTMVMLNTWGDRGQDKRIGEAFALAEIESGARLGVSHFQLDDGWQKGRSSNSATAGGTLARIWETPGYWEPNPERFPNGLGPVARRAGELGVELCIWFNPSADDDNARWHEDAGVLVGLYRAHGIRTFKIDGVKIPSRRAERNFFAMLDEVSDATGGTAVFNLDVTAGRRLGYLYANRYGNLFLENRYTDWVNYYPHWTLRNLWQLSRYLQPQSFQIEFLNRWRNAEKYPAGDPLAPSVVPFDYCFAVTMAAQPLAWFEASGLPEEAFSLGETMRRYRDCQADLHAGTILPIGEEPDGAAWTGFQSLQEGRGYLLVYRERTDRKSATLRLWGLEGRSIRLRVAAGHGAGGTRTVSASGEVTFELPQRFSWCLYAYDVQAP